MKRSEWVTSLRTLTPRQWLGIACIFAIAAFIAVVFLLLALGMSGVQK